MNEDSDLKSYSFYIHKKNIPKNFRIVIRRYAKELRKTRYSISRYIQENLEIKYQIFFNLISENKLITLLKNNRKKSVDSVAYQQAIRQVFIDYSNLCDSIKYKMTKKESNISGNRTESVEKLIKIKSYLIKLKFEKESDLLEYLDSKSGKFYEECLKYLKRDKSLFKAIRKYQLNFIRRMKINYKSLTFRTINVLHHSKKFLAQISKNKVIITMNLPKTSKYKQQVVELPVKVNRKYHGDLREYKSILTFVTDKFGNEKPKQNKTSYICQLLLNGNLRIILTREKQNNKVEITDCNDFSKLIGVDMNISDNLFSLSNRKMIKLNKNFLIKEKNLSESVSQDQEWKEFNNSSKRLNKRLQFQSKKQERRRKFYSSYYTNELAKYLVKKGINHCVIEDLNTNETKGFKIKHPDLEITYKDISRAIHFSDLKNEILRILPKFGIRVSLVNPRYTSQTCSHCGHIDLNSRNSRQFKCTKCGYKNHADINASINIKNRMSNPYLRENFQVYDRENDLWKGNWKSFKSCYTKIYKNL